MIVGIDHLVIAVRSVEAAAAELEAVVGLSVTGGGRHEGMGTLNRLAFLGDTYLELIGIEDEALVRSNPEFAVGKASLAILAGGHEGLATFALAVDDIEDEVARLRDAGSPISPPIPGFRRRPDGEVVRWWVAFPELGPERPPFLIQHELEGAEWGPEARARRAAARHPAGGAVRLATLELAVRDAAAVAEAYGHELGIAFSEGWRVVVGDEQSVVLREGGGVPVVELAVEPGTPALDLERFGVRWRRVEVPWHGTTDAEG
jgi:hypothetical protein